MSEDGGVNFLGLNSSVTGRRWIGPDNETQRAAQTLEQQAGYPAALCQVLARRGVTAATADSFLSPALRDLLPDPRKLRDMHKAAERFLDAVDRHERIAVFADYDVDGGASACHGRPWNTSAMPRPNGCGVVAPEALPGGHRATLPAGSIPVRWLLDISALWPSCIGFRNLAVNQVHVGSIPIGHPLKKL